MDRSLYPSSAVIADGAGTVGPEQPFAPRGHPSSVHDPARTSAMAAPAVHEAVHEPWVNDATGVPSGATTGRVCPGNALVTRREGDLGSSQWGFDSPRPHSSP